MSGFPAQIASFFVFCLFILAGSASAAPAGSADGFLLLPGGEFQMGSPDSERLREADEVLHTVRISPFFVDPYEVTQEAMRLSWAAIPVLTGGNACQLKT